MPKDVLKAYHEKRQFEHTTEPRGSKTKKIAQRIFVVQKHAARSLHYDFRLEVNGVLKSWAVPKGPPLEPHERRLAVMTEDHPIEYAQFAGTIPKGNYGAGSVEIWDSGGFELFSPDEDPAEKLEQGHLKVRLHGKKLKGLYALVRTEMHNQRDWLLIKMEE
jgi:bifunctional non-homologous end joining protein LigD